MPECKSEQVGGGVHVVLFPSPGIGHLIPLAELAKRLVLLHNIKATIITFSSCDPTQQSFLASLPPGISSLPLPPIPLDDLPAGTHVVPRLSIAMSRSAPFIHGDLLALHKTARVAAYIIDIFGGDTLSAAAKLGIPGFIFFTTNFHCLSGILEKNRYYSSDSNRETTEWMVRHAAHLERVDGIMVNSFEAMERGAARAFRERGSGKPPIVPVGPLTRTAREGLANSCAQWLDRQGAQSVLLVSLGSGGTLSFEQMREMALGLEMSGERFLWVMRAPANSNSSAAYFSSGDSAEGALTLLPKGFMERTRERGIVLLSWAPQEEILAHSATGAFLSHCGWNSTLESITNGVPMIAWPLYAEQPLNAAMLVEGARVALRPAGCAYKDDGTVLHVRREDIADVVKESLQGERGKEARRRMRELKEAATKAVAEDGPSTKNLASIVDHWKKTSAASTWKMTNPV